MIEYFFRSSIVFAALLLPWLLWLRHQTFFQWQRIYLLGMGFASLLIPLLPSFTEAQAVQTELLPVVITNIIQPKSENTILSNWSIAELIYFSGLLFFTFVFLKRLLQLVNLFRQSEKDENGFYLLKENRTASAFSVFGSVFISGEMDEETRGVVIRHEQVHIREKHTVDILFYEILILLFWFNPMFRVVRKQLAATHEFIADEQACGEDAVRYKQVLVAHVLGLPRQVLIHPFSEPGNLKQRMIMLTKNRTRRRARWAYLLVFPLTALTISLNSFTLAAPQKTIVMAAEQNAEYKGGQEAMIKFLSENIRYPEEARKAKTAGTVYVAFTIDKNGKVTNATIKKSVSELLDAEALRVVQLMPGWIPAKQNGQPVESEMILPIKFALD